MKNYSKVIANVPQSQPIPGKNMVQNHAGGYVFEITPQERLERFLLIGSEGGTAYVSEQKLTVENATVIIQLIKSEGLRVVSTVLDFAINSRAPKADPGIFVLALCSTHGDADTKSAAYSAISSVCRTSTHLFTFLSNVQALRGWSRGLRRGVSAFYLSRTPEQIAYQMVKYRNRAGFTHRDALRLSHVKAPNPSVNSLFGYAAGKVVPSESGSSLVMAFEAAQKVEGKVLIDLIKENNLTWEMVPVEKLNDKEVLVALLDKMPLVALIRNLNRFSYNGLTDSNNEVVKTIVGKLTNEELVAKSGIHPLNVINSMATYSSGHGNKGSKTWTANQNIVDALNDTYNLALKALVPTGKNILLGVDVSGSMDTPVGGMSLTCTQIAQVLALTVLKSEKNAEMVWFDTELKAPTIGRRSSVDEALNANPNGGGTDCAQPLKHALTTKTKYDAIVILTDNETWAGEAHSLTLLEEYRRKVNRDVKIVEVAITATGSSSYPDDDKNLLRVVGFDASVVDIISAFLK